MIQWHPRAHEDWANEQLYFWRFSFLPTYEPGVVKQHLRDVLEASGVRSYTAYDLLGLHDVMLRAWLPSGVRPWAFNDALSQGLSAANLHVSDSFSVSKIQRHWLWDDGHGEVLPPSEQRLNQGPPSDDVLRAIDEGVITPDVAALQADGLLRTIDAEPGVKFFMHVNALQNAPDVTRTTLYRRINDILGRAPIGEPSLYLGHGFGAADMLIMGRIPFERFYDLGDQLSFKIGALADLLAVRTYTYPTGAPGFLLYSERMPFASDDGGSSVVSSASDILTMGEGLRVEVKGAAFTNLDRLLSGDGHLDPTDGASVVRAVVGLLNARGGDVLIGALEAARFSLPATRAKFPNAYQHAGYIVVGVDVDIQGAHDEDWYERKLHDSILNSISPAPHNLVRVEFDDVGGQRCAVVRVIEPQKGWYYTKDGSFFVREGNLTQGLKGLDADSYKAASGRG